MVMVIGVDEFGGPEKLKVFDIPAQPVGSGQVRVDVAAAAVSPTDTIHRSGGRAELLQQDPPPYVPGMDIAGVISEIGDGVDHVAVGDEVMGIVAPTASHGGYSSSIVLPARSVARAPQGSSAVEACTLPMNGLTAQYALDLLDLPKGAILAVTGAAGAFGGYMVQLGANRGLRVIADSSAADEDLVRSLGAHEVIRRGDDIADRIRALVPDGVDGLADGSIQNELLLPAVRDNGGFAAVRGFQGPSERGITLHQVWVREYRTELEKLDELRALTESGSVTLRVAATFPADQASEAHRMLEAGGTRGRCVITF
ncbi:MAG: alcohol dehydrogenase [Acidimicrobiaceae bacterium]|nr:alcohol dehydrogenase [Acidimicrobiaceae bacterium]HBU76322.1 alcohol dehydrogenase [Acidimicrobiaceae bacterium]